MPQVSRLAGFSIRSSGRDLSAVRRAIKAVAVKDAKPKVEKADSGPRANPEPKTKARAPERNDATVRPDVPRE